MRRFIICGVIALATGPGAAAAEDILFELRADEARPIQAAPPGGLLSTTGPSIDSTTVGGTYGVTGVERQSTGLHGSDTWIRIVPVGPDGAPEGTGGWAAYDEDAFGAASAIAAPYDTLLGG